MNSYSLQNSMLKDVRALEWLAICLFEIVAKRDSVRRV